MLVCYRQDGRQLHQFHPPKLSTILASGVVALVHQDISSDNHIYDTGSP